MSLLKNLVFLVIGLVTLGSVVRPSVAQPSASVQEAIEQLVEAGWSSTLAARAAADQTFEALEVRHPQLSYAYAVVKMKQHRYAEALELVDRVLQQQPDDIYALRAKIWLSLLVRNPQEALVAAERLSRMIGQQPEAELDQQERLQWARFLGRMFGYLEGPGQELVSPLLVAGERRKVLRQLDPEQAEAFEQGSLAVAELYGELALESEQALAEAQQEAEEERERKRRELEAQADQLVQQQQRLNERRDELQSDLRAALDELSQREAQVAASLAPLETEMALLRRDLALILDDINRLRLLLGREEDPELRDRLLLEIANLEQLASYYDSDLYGLERRAAVLLRQRAAVQAQRQQTQNRYAGQLQAIDAQLADVRRQQRRLQAQYRRLDRETVVSRRARSLDAQAAALPTYEPFPLEEERQRLLAH